MDVWRGTVPGFAAEKRSRVLVTVKVAPATHESPSPARGGGVGGRDGEFAPVQDPGAAGRAQFLFAGQSASLAACEWWA